MMGVIVGIPNTTTSSHVLLLMGIIAVDGSDMNLYIKL